MVINRFLIVEPLKVKLSSTLNNKVTNLRAQNEESNQQLLQF